MDICISIDLDDYQDYQSLVQHGRTENPISFYDEAIPRYLDLFDRVGARATFFMIGRDGARAENRAAIREVAARGHEVGNHSFSHPYNFRALTREQKEAEIADGERAIADILGERPVGFRTPSCDVDCETLEILGDRGYAYDSSVFPTPVMWLFMVYGKIFVRRDEYQLGDPRAVFAPVRPYVPSRDALYRARAPGEPQAGVLEIPVSVTATRIPFYSTFSRLLGNRFLDRCVAARRGESELHMLFHLIEMADFTGTDLGDSISNTPGIGISADRRREFVRRAVETLAGAGSCVPMRDVARRERAERGMTEAA